MVLVDSNVFIIDRFFPRDTLHPENRAFIERLADFEAAISSFTLLEICGVAGFRLSSVELESWIYRFAAVYPVLILDLFGLKGQHAEEWWSDFVKDIADRIARKMSLGDATLLREAEHYGVEALVTWNTKDFLRRTKIPVMTPARYIRHIR